MKMFAVNDDRALSTSALDVLRILSLFELFT